MSACFDNSFTFTCCKNQEKMQFVYYVNERNTYLELKSKYQHINSKVTYILQ